MPAARCRGSGSGLQWGVCARRPRPQVPVARTRVRPPHFVPVRHAWDVWVPELSSIPARAAASQPVPFPFPSVTPGGSACCPWWVFDLRGPLCGRGDACQGSSLLWAARAPSPWWTCVSAPPGRAGFTVCATFRQAPGQAGAVPGRPVSRGAHRSSAKGTRGAAGSWGRERLGPPRPALPPPAAPRMLLWRPQGVAVLFKARARAVQPREGAERGALGEVGHAAPRGGVR